MNREDLLNAVPNKEAVDVLMINRAYDLLAVWKRFSDRAEEEPFYYEELSREGHDRRVKNSFWTDYKNITSACIQILKELNLTPLARKSLKSTASSGIPSLTLKKAQ